MSQNGSFIFLDPRGRRWPMLRRLAFATGAILVVSAILFVRSLLVTPEPKLPAAVVEMKGLIRALQTRGEDPKPARPLWLEFSRDRARMGGGRPAGADREKAGGIVLGFYSGWDPRAKESFLAHGEGLTHVSPEWITLVDGKG